MTECAYCSEEELLPFTCSYCKEKFCRMHHLPEKHDCKGLTKEKWQSKRRAEREKPQVQEARRPIYTSVYKKAYEVPGVTEVIERTAESRRKISAGHFDVNEKLIAAAILILILVLGVLSRFL